MKRVKGITLGILIFLMAMSLFVRPTGVMESNDFLSQPEINEEFIESGVTATQLYNVSAYSLSYGSNTTVVFGGAMNNSDATNASFVESLTVVTAGTVLGDTYTDDATLWDEQYRFKNLEVVADGAEGSNSIRAQFSANNGEPILAFDNGTTQTMALDTSTMDKVNVSIKYSEAAGAIPTTTYLHEITFHNSAGTYYYLTLDQALTTTWTTISGTRAQAVSVGGMQANSPINWIEFHYTSPVANRWVYIDNLVFENEANQHQLSLMLNVTGIAPYDSYTLNVSAASNITSPESMVLSDGFDENAVYLVDDADWNNFTILLNRTKILAQTYLQFYWNSSLVSDTRNSTLDIDLFQIYAWNETNTRPSVDGAVVNNLDDTRRMYAGYRTYQFELNVSDADGFDDIDYARIGLETEDGEYIFKAGFQEDTGTFVEETNPNNITLASTSTNTSSGTAIYITFHIVIETAVPSISDLLLSCYVNDTEGLSDHPDYALDYEVERDIEFTSTTAIPDEGPAGSYTTITCTMSYYNSSDLVPPLAYYDVWLISQNGTSQTQVDTWDTSSGVFTVNVLTMNAIGVEQFLCVAVAEGVTPTSDVYLTHEDHFIGFTTMSGGANGGSGGFIVPIPPEGIAVIGVVGVLGFAIVYVFSNGWLAAFRIPKVSLPKLRRSRPYGGTRTARKRSFKLGTSAKLIGNSIPSGRQSMSIAKAIMRALKFKR